LKNARRAPTLPDVRPDPPASPEPWRGGPTAAWPRYRDNLARHLIGISRDLQSRVRRALEVQYGHRGLRPSFGPFLSLLWHEGRPLGAIAAELAISNQACGQLADLVEAAGYLERRRNPEDRRSRLVVLTPRGRRLVEQGVRIILESEAEYAALVGAGAYRRFTNALAALYRGLGLPVPADPERTARASRSVGVLPLVELRMQRELIEATAARGHAGLKTSHGEVLPLIGPDGGRIHAIARVQRVSRQAVSATTRDLEALGYLRREPDPRDRRGVVLRLTSRGEELIGASVAALDELERSFREILGDGRLEHLRRVARDLHEALHLEAEVFERRSGPRAAPGAAGPRPRRGGHDIQRLATSLRRRLGRGDAARLAALLEPRAGRATRVHDRISGSCEEPVRRPAPREGVGSGEVEARSHR
jgi:DNA-binding MarR family transcriptional regulator